MPFSRVPGIPALRSAGFHAFALNRDRLSALRPSGAENIRTTVTSLPCRCVPGSCQGSVTRAGGKAAMCAANAIDAPTGSGTENPCRSGGGGGYDAGRTCFHDPVLPFWWVPPRKAAGVPPCNGRACPSIARPDEHPPARPGRSEAGSTGSTPTHSATPCRPRHALHCPQPPARRLCLRAGRAAPGDAGCSLPAIRRTRTGTG
jgi:hypothetical protein